MCGVFGTTCKIDKENLTNIVDTLKHRGPDDRGIWLSDDISLGHRRLAIIDTSNGGHQPMSDPSNRYHMVYNGEVYNYVEIRKELIRLGVSFLTDSDTEVVLKSYIQWGEKALSKFNGMWAIAIWDSKLKRLFLSRDRFGKKPLFYLSLSKGFTFASEMKALYPFIENITHNTKNAFFSYGNLFKYEASEDCMIDGIKRFPAGHYGYLENGALKIECYWKTLENLISIPNNYGEQVEMFSELFKDSVRLRMRSNVPVATALSGGIDSSAIFATALEHIKANQSENYNYSAFSAVFDNGGIYDESKKINEITEFLKSRTNFVNIDVAKSRDTFLYDTYVLEDYYLTSHIPMIQLYGSMRDNGVKVSIDGHGADELFSGYGATVLAAASDAGLNPFELKNVMDAYYGIYEETQEGHGQQMPKWKMFLQNYMKNLKSYRSKEIFVSKSKEVMDRFTHSTVLPTLLRNYDRYSMSQGVEVRMPFLDHRIVSFAFSLPWQSKLKNGYTKSIVRDALKNKLPRSVLYNRPKVGFSAPLTSWMRGDFRELLYDTFHSQEFREFSIINAKLAISELDTLMHKDYGSIQLSAKVWSTFSLYMSFLAAKKYKYVIQ